MLQTILISEYTRNTLKPQYHALTMIALVKRGGFIVREAVSTILHSTSGSINTTEADA